MNQDFASICDEYRQKINKEKQVLIDFLNTKIKEDVNYVCNFAPDVVEHLYMHDAHSLIRWFIIEHVMHAQLPTIVIYDILQILKKDNSNNCLITMLLPQLSVDMKTRLENNSKFFKETSLFSEIN